MDRSFTEVCHELAFDLRPKYLMAIQDTASIEELDRCLEDIKADMYREAIHPHEPMGLVLGVGIRCAIQDKIGELMSGKVITLADL